jgi:hypothetical protein
LLGHKGKKKSLLITLKQENKIQQYSEPIRKTHTNEELRNEALEYDISLGHQVIKSKMKSRVHEVGVHKEFFVLKFDLRTEYIKEYMYEEVKTEKDFQIDRELFYYKVKESFILLFTLKENVFKFLNRTNSGRTILEFSPKGITFNEDNSIGVTKLVFDNVKLEDYDYEEVSKNLGSDSIKIFSNSFIEMIKYSNKFNIAEVSVYLGEKSGSGVYLYTLFYVEESYVCLRFFGTNFSDPKMTSTIQYSEMASTINTKSPLPNKMFIKPGQGSIGYFDAMIILHKRFPKFEFSRTNQ